MSTSSDTIDAARTSHWRRYRVLYAVIAVCIAPVVASYFAYYVAPPSGRTNYGTLIAPPRPVPAELRMTGAGWRRVLVPIARGQVGDGQRKPGGLR